MIKITDRLYLDCDKFGWALKEKVKNKKTGEYSYRGLAYHSKLKPMILSLEEFLTRKQLESKETTLRKAVNTLNEVSELLIRKVDECEELWRENHDISR